MNMDMDMDIDMNMNYRRRIVGTCILSLFRSLVSLSSGLSLASLTYALRR